MVGTWDGKDLLYVVAMVNVVTGALLANSVESPAATRRSGSVSKTRRLQQVFAAHLRHGGSHYPPKYSLRVVLLMDNAPWHRGVRFEEALAEHSPLELKRFPS